MSTNITALANVDGFIGACLVDSASGMMLAAESGSGRFDPETAGAANTNVVRSKNEAIEALGLNEEIEDILITLGSQYHLIRPLSKNKEVFLYVALDRKKANLAMARLQVRRVEETLEI